MTRWSGKGGRELRRRLAVFGFDGGDSGGPSSGGTNAGARLRGALHGLGPVARSLGLELSTRLDLLPPADAFELSWLEARPTPHDDLDALLADLLGKDEVAEVEPLPFHQTPTQEWRRARLADGTTVDLTIAWRGEPIEIGVEVGRWRSCLDRLRAPRWEAFEPSDLEQFEDRLTHGLSLDHQAWALEQASQDAGGGMVWAPPVRRLCRPSLLVTLALEPFSQTGGIVGRGPALGGDEGDAARETRRIVLAWLEAALFDGWVPQPPLAAHLALTAEGQVASRGGLRRIGDPRLRYSIRTYLAAVVDGDADHALDALLALSHPADRGNPRRDSVSGLRHLFRQAEPFRDGSATGAASGGRIADVLFLHWRLLRRNGYRPREGWWGFQQGLADLEWLARRHAAHRDVLEEALDDLRWIDLAHEGRELLTPGAWPRRLAATLPALDEIDEHLRALAAPEDERATRRPPRFRLAALVVVAALGVAIRRHPPLVDVEPWLALGFAALAISLLASSFLGRDGADESPF